MTVYTLHLPEDKSVEINQLNRDGNLRYCTYYVVSHDGQQVEIEYAPYVAVEQDWEQVQDLELLGSLLGYRDYEYTITQREVCLD